MLYWVSACRLVHCRSLPLIVCQRYYVVYITEISFRQSKNISLCTFKDATQLKTLLNHARQWRLKQTESRGVGGLDLSKTDEPEKKGSGYG